MSKTTGNVVNPLDLVDNVGVDGFRYYVLADTPYGHDGDFTYEGLIARYNSDLANNLGNLLARVATVVETKCGGIGPAPRPTARSPPPPPRRRRRPPRRGTSRAEPRPRRHLELIRATNAHLEANEPWKPEPGPQVDAVIGDALEALRIVASSPPRRCRARARQIWERIGLDGRSPTSVCRPPPSGAGIRAA